jgi:hypothetical protein
MVHTMITASAALNIHMAKTNNLGTGTGQYLPTTMLGFLGCRKSDPQYEKICAPDLRNRAPILKSGADFLRSGALQRSLRTAWAET